MTLKGLKYSLDGAVVTDTFPVGVSNEATEEHPVIGVKKGTLAVIWRCPFAVPETGRPDSDD